MRPTDTFFFLQAIFDHFLMMINDFDEAQLRCSYYEHINLGQQFKKRGHCIQKLPNVVALQCSLQSSLKNSYI